MNIDQIASEALQLDPKDRALLAETIWESLEDPYAVASEISDEEAVKLAIQRDDEIENGKVTSIPHKEMMDRLRRDES
jgi:putative addiction module component (TIGR02574 family)